MTWLLAEVGRPGRAQDVLYGGDVESTTGRLLSVAELQRALHVTGPVGRRPAAPPVAAAAPVQAVTGPPAGPGSGSGPRPDPAQHLRWIAVLGAHGGAGTSTVALAVADAAAAQGCGVHLVGCSPPAHCGLLAVTSIELGVEPGGHWRSGRRGPRIAVDRLTGTGPGAAPWPASPARGSGELLTVVDLEPDAGRHVSSVAGAVAVLVVCRVSVPGVRHAERLLEALGPSGRPVLVAAVGPSGWPGVVVGSSGPLLRGLREAGRVVHVPVDRRLDSTGPTGAALPRQVGVAGRAVLRLVAPVLPAFAGLGSRRPRRPVRARTASVPARPAPDRLTVKDT